MMPAVSVVVARRRLQEAPQIILVLVAAPTLLVGWTKTVIRVIIMRNLIIVIMVAAMLIMQLAGLPMKPAVFVEEALLEGLHCGPSKMRRLQMTVGIYHLSRLPTVLSSYKRNAMHRHRRAGGLTAITTFEAQLMQPSAS